MNPVSVLNERCQKLNYQPRYDLVEEERALFKCKLSIFYMDSSECDFNGDFMGVEFGEPRWKIAFVISTKAIFKNKTEAKKEAALKALEKMDKGDGIAETLRAESNSNLEIGQNALLNKLAEKYLRKIAELTREYEKAKHDLEERLKIA